MKFSILYPIVALSATSLTLFAGGQAFDLTRSTIDGGGAMRSTSADGVLELSGTIGQPDAGVLSGGGFTLTGGFWFETPPGDCNNDGGTGLTDVASFEACMAGPVGPPPTGACRCFDVDRSGLVDLRDFAIIQEAFVGQ